MNNKIVLNSTNAVESIQNKIYIVRGEKVMLDFDLARLYQVKTKILNQAVKRNIKRFPVDFMFKLNKIEEVHLKSQIVTSSVRESKKPNLITQIVISSYGGRRKPTYAFTEQGIAMLSSVLRSDRAVQVNIQIMRTFIRLRQMLSSHKELKEKIEQLEKKYDGQFKLVFEAIQQLIIEEEKPREKLGFNTP